VDGHGESSIIRRLTGSETAGNVQYVASASVYGDGSHQSCEQVRQVSIEQDQSLCD
jgi:hypothetical protein